MAEVVDPAEAAREPAGEASREREVDLPRAAGSAAASYRTTEVVSAKRGPHFASLMCKCSGSGGCSRSGCGMQHVGLASRKAPMFRHASGRPASVLLPAHPAMSARRAAWTRSTWLSPTPTP